MLDCGFMAFDGSIPYSFGWLFRPAGFFDVLGFVEFVDVFDFVDVVSDSCICASVVVFGADMTVRVGVVG